MSQFVVFSVGLDASETQSVSACAESLGFQHSGVASFAELARVASRTTAACLVLSTKASDNQRLAVLADAVELQSVASPVVIVDRGDVATAVEAMRRGAETVVERAFDAPRWTKAIEVAAQASRQRVAAAQIWVETLRRVEQLSTKERAVMDLVLNGSPNKAIATSLSMAQRTVERLRSVILKRLEARTAVELARKVAEARAWAATPRVLPQIAGIPSNNGTRDLQDVA